MEQGNNEHQNVDGERGDFLEEPIQSSQTASLPETVETSPEPELPDVAVEADPELPEQENRTLASESPPDDAGDENGALDSESDELDEPENEADQITSAEVIEAILFASDEPVTVKKLAEMVGAGGVKEIKGHLEQLNQKYQQLNCAFRIEAVAGGYQMLTMSKFNFWLRKLVRVREETKLTPAALETLAIIAYKQPVIRVDVEAIRGVGCGEMIRQLCDKGMVKIVGRAEVLGRPLLYGTTRKFLEVFGLSSLKDLPQAEQLKAPY